MNPHTLPRDEAQERFGARLRMQREARELSIADVVKVTKIPERSIHLLEEGAFRELPAEVFVRGFLKSYSRCVGLEVDEILREYEELVGQAQRPGAPPSLARPAPPRDPRIATGESLAVAPRAERAPSAPHGVVAPVEGVPPVAEPAAEPEKKTEKEPEEVSVFDQLARAGRSTSRASLTVAVIILVIVATVTLSLLLRRPGHVGDGVSSVPPATRRA